MVGFAKILILVFFLSAQAKPLLPTLDNAPWSEVYKNPHFVISWPHLAMEGVMVPLNNICDKGAKFKSVLDVTYCVAYKVTLKQVCIESEGESCSVVPLNYKPRRGENIRESFECAKSVTHPLEASKAYQVLKCSGEVVFPTDEQSSPPYCKGQWIVKWEQYDGKYQVPILSKDNPDQDYRVLSYKNYVIQCP